MLAKDIDALGGVKIDARGVANPRKEETADQNNRKTEDLAQMTRTVRRVLVKFATTVDAGPVAVPVLAGSRSIWGSGSGQHPTIQKTATGVYVITYAAEYEDALVGTDADAVAETEAVDFTFSRASVGGPVAGFAQTVSSSNVITVYVFNTGGAASDLLGGVQIQVEGS